MSMFVCALRAALRNYCVNRIYPNDVDDDDDVIGLESLDEGGVMKIGRLTYTYGCTSQAFLPGRYSGAQCTTMALASVILNESTSRFTPTSVNKILLEGNRLHAKLRDDLKLSHEKDRRIAIEDIPYKYFIYLGEVFETLTTIRLLEQSQYVFTTKKEGFEEFSTIKEYLRRWQRSKSTRTGFLITLGDFSYSVILKMNGRVALFDSHGHLTLNGELIEQKAGVLQFPSLEYLEQFLVGMYGFETPAVIAPVYVYLIKLTRREKPARNVKQPEPKPYQPYFPTESDEKVFSSHTKKDDEITDDCSPYIGMMGGMF
ncbi:uncharacterized protein LOC123532500 [Mercenaria mercenaria]|uniref:uncharacterized protein LOC123532500 n=1 Tax=Mercenaria mercenaria TaxID=6596 RepID=UPI00234EF4FB|nr:uncharacterized protein LOC123532500 [Mercenaria mercenaria]